MNSLAVILESIVHDVTSVFRLVTLDLVKHSFREVRNVFKPTFKLKCDIKRKNEYDSRNQYPRN